jgi:limonene-1,2-epoxide hydrolase
MTPGAVVERLRSAVDAHDLDAVGATFASDYRNEWPAHPARGFVGRDQVRANWQRIFTALPDVQATVDRIAVDGDIVWTEWEMCGHRPDGATQMQRGVIIFGMAGDEIAWGRFYLEPVEAGGDGIDAAVGQFAGDAE